VETNQLLFSANLTFILTNVYGWLLKWFYKPQAYSGNFVQLLNPPRPMKCRLMSLMKYMMCCEDAD